MTIKYILVSIIIVGVTLLSFLFIMAFTRGRKKSRPQKAKETPPDQLELVPGGTSGQASYDGLTYGYEHFQGTSKAAPYFKITIPCTASGGFTIKRETWFERFFKKLGVCVEIDTHDPAFDDTFYISTETIPFTRRFLEKPENRRAVREVFDMGFNHLERNGMYLTLTWHNFTRREQMEVRIMERAVAQLVDPVSHLEKIPYVTEPASAAREFKRWLAFALPTILLVTGLAAGVIGMLRYPPLDEGNVFLSSLLVSVPLFILFTWFSFHLLKGRSSSHRELIGVFFFSLFVFPLAGNCFNTFFNGALDLSPPEAHRVAVLQKKTVRSDGENSYYAVVRSWREDTAEPTEKLEVSRRLYQSLEPGSSFMTITTKPGAFGFEWIVRME
jgi:hypothetical protein